MSATEKTSAKGSAKGSAGPGKGPAMSDVDNWFVYHAPKEGQPETYQMIRERAKVLAEIFVSFCPDSRERSLALTKLRESVMWANAAIACNE